MNHWDEKFKAAEYIYGVEPNESVRSIFNTKSYAKIALLAEGAGKIAVFSPVAVNRKRLIMLEHLISCKMYLRSMRVE